MPRMILLGVGTGVPDVDRDYTHMVWAGPGGPLLIDAGGSTYQHLLRAGIDPCTLAGIVLTHSHADHINGLPGLLFSAYLAGRRTPWPIYGLAPTLTVAQGLVEAAYLERIVVPQVWTPIEAGAVLSLADGWQLQTALTLHSRPCLALRFAGPTGTLVYSADTAPCETVAALAAGADILIHEATVAEPFEAHTTPRQAGELALRLGIGRLILVHYSPQWTMPEAAALAAVRASGYTGVAEIGRAYQVVSCE